MLKSYSWQNLSSNLLISYNSSELSESGENIETKHFQFFLCLTIAFFRSFQDIPFSLFVCFFVQVVTATNMGVFHSQLLRSRASSSKRTWCKSNSNEEDEKPMIKESIAKVLNCVAEKHFYFFKLFQLFEANCGKI